MEKKKAEKKPVRKNVKAKTNKSKKVEKKGVSFSLIEVIVITLITAVVVSICSAIIVYKNYDTIVKNYSNTYSSALSEFITTYDHIMDSYVEKIDENELVDNAIRGMFNYLEDSHTNYMDEESTVTLQERLDGEYTGAGVEISDTENGVIIVTIFEGGPAEKAGLMVGDEIISLNGIDVTGKGASYVSNVIKNKTDKFELTVVRDGETKTFELVTANIVIPSVSTKIIDKTGYMIIDTFSATTYDQVKEKLEALEKEGIENLIIDVRNNTGGYLSSAYQISDLFIEKGKIIYQLKDKEGNVEAYNAKKESERTYKIAVLINRGSASASEILASALNESYGAILVGETSFGKGTVQETETLTSGSMIKYTTAYWLTPKGNCVEAVGIKPTHEVIENLETEDDEQFNEALRLINE